MTYDIYQATADSSLRMATRPGSGLPNHVEPEDWELMPEVDPGNRTKS
jgi:hypothetical protein